MVSVRHKPVVEPSIRKRPNRGTKPDARSEATTDARAPNGPSKKDDTKEAQPKPPPRKTRPTVEPARPELYNFRFAASREFKEKFEWLAEVLGVENAQMHVAEIFEQALEKKDPKKKLERRKACERKQRHNASRTRPRPGEVAKKDKNRPPASSRYVSSEVRERVLARANYRCEYRGPNGRRCGSRTGLEIEHKLPFAIYKSHEEAHLRAFCSAHNRFAAERVYGSEFIQGKIAGNRNGRASPHRRGEPEQVRGTGAVE